MERLCRSQKQRIIAGVAGGLAEYFSVDVALVRLLWILAIFVGGGGVLAYIIAWIIIPDGQWPFAEYRTRRTEEAGGWRGDDTATPSSGEQGDGWRVSWVEAGTKRRRNAGLVLIGLGIIFLAHRLFGSLFHFTWPLLLVIAGVYLLLAHKGGEQ